MGTRCSTGLSDRPHLAPVPGMGERVTLFRRYWWLAHGEPPKLSRWVYDALGREVEAMRRKVGPLPEERESAAFEERFRGVSERSAEVDE